MSLSEDNNFYFHEANFINQNGELKTTKIPVVQELSRTNHFPERFIASGHHQLDTLTETPPVIDITKLQSLHGSRTPELQKLAAAAKEWGLFLIKNHGVVLDDVKDVVKGFFELSYEEKKKCVGSYESIDNMGYGKNFVKSEDQPLDWIDRLTMKAAPVHVDESTNELSVWPKKPSNFR